MFKSSNTWLINFLSRWGRHSPKSFLRITNGVLRFYSKLPAPILYLTNLIFDLIDIANIYLLDLYSTIKYKLSSKNKSSILIGDSSLPLVSVIMTSYNCEEYITNSIESILNQTYEKIEFIIIDDASTDGTFGIIQEYAQNDKRIRSFRLPVNKGTFWAKNFGLKHASADIVSFQDADDTSEPFRISEQLNILLTKPHVSIVTCNHIRHDKHGNLLSICARKKSTAYISAMFRKSNLIEQVGYFDSVRNVADVEFIWRVRLHFGQGSHYNIRKVLYKALFREDSLSTEYEEGFQMLGIVKKGRLSHFLVPSTLAYFCSFLNWHTNVSKKGNTPYIDYLCSHLDDKKINKSKSTARIVNSYKTPIKPQLSQRKLKRSTLYQHNLTTKRLVLVDS